MLYDLSYMWNLKKQRTPIKQTCRKRDPICGYQRWGRCGGGQEELDEGGQKEQTSSCQINIRDKIYNMTAIINTIVNTAVGI